jgi:hypothetical protein
MNAFSGRGGEFRVVLAGAHRDTPLDARADNRRRGNISALEGRPNCNHAAADVDAHGRRDHGPLGGKNRSDRCALSVMAVGHDGDVLEHERHRRRVEDLLLCLRLDRVPWKEDDCLVIDRFHRIEANEVMHVGQGMPDRRNLYFELTSAHVRLAKRHFVANAPDGDWTSCPLAYTTARFLILYDDSVCAVGADTLGTDTLKEGCVFESTAGPPLRASISPRTRVATLVVALLKIVMTIRFHGELS